MKRYFAMRKVPLFCTLFLEGRLYPDMELRSDRVSERERSLFFSGRWGPEGLPITIIIREFRIKRIAPDRYRFSGRRELPGAGEGETVFRYVEGEFVF